jgi:hypothetical protein
LRLRKKKNPSERIARTPKATPTPTPAFAPLDSPDDDDGDGDGDGDEDEVADGDEVGAVAVVCWVDVLLLAEAVASGAKTCAMVTGDLSQHSVLLPQHQVFEVAVPSHGITMTISLELPTPGFLRHVSKTLKYT